MCVCVSARKCNNFCIQFTFSALVHSSLYKSDFHSYMGKKKQAADSAAHCVWCTMTTMGNKRLDSYTHTHSYTCSKGACFGFSGGEGRRGRGEAHKVLPGIAGTQLWSGRVVTYFICTMTMRVTRQTAATTTTTTHPPLRKHTLTHTHTHTLRARSV